MLRKSTHIKFYIFQHETENRLAFSVAFYKLDKNFMLEFRREIYLDTLENYTRFESLVASHGYKQTNFVPRVSFIEVTWRV